MQYGVERHGDLYRGHDGEPERRELRGELLDAEPESGQLQRRRGERSAVDGDGSVFDLLDGTGDSYRTDGFGHDQHWDEPGVDGGLRSDWMHGQL